jgi:hypothetical protein
MGYQGMIIPIPCGLGGLDASTNPEQTRVDGLIIADNIRFDNKTVTRVGGLAKYNASAVTGSPNLIEAIDWFDATNHHNIVSVWDDGNVYVASAGDIDSATAYNSNVTIEHPVTFVEGGCTTVGGNRNLYVYCQDFACPQVIQGDGVTSANISNVSLDWANYAPYSAIYHDGRIWAFGAPDYPHSLYCSDLNNHGNFNNDFNTPIYDIYPGEGERIAACYSYLPQEMAIFKFPRGIYTINTTSVPDYFLPVSKIRDDIGVAGPHAITKVGSFGIWFIDSLGHIYDLQTLSDPGLNPTDADITEKLHLTPWINQFVDKSKIEWARLYYDAQRKEVWASFIGLDSADAINNKVLVFDVTDPSNVRCCVDNRGEYFQSIFSYRESDGEVIPYCGGLGGMIYKSNQASTGVNGVAYLSDFQTPHTDLGWYSQQLKLAEKRFDWLDLVLVPAGASNITLATYIDGSLYKSYVITIGTSFSTLDGTTATLSPPDSGETDFTLCGGSVQRYKLRIGGRGQKISFKFSTTGVGEQYSIISMNLYCKPLAEKGQVQT